VNTIAWLLHLGVLAWCWPLIRFWWTGDATLGYDGGNPHGRKRWAVLAAFLLPVVAWCWLVPLSIGHRWRNDERARIARRNEEIAQRYRDIAFWREQAASGDLVSAFVAAELLTMWGVPVTEEPRKWVTSFDRALAEALPGAHEYSETCVCRNCERARRACRVWRPGGPVSNGERLSGWSL